MHTKALYFLAIPYHGTAEEKAYRVGLSLKAAANFLRQGLHVFAPIIYINPIAEELALQDISERRALLTPYTLNFLESCKGMILLTAQGWETSIGIRHELEFCLIHNIPVYQISPEEIEGDLSQTLTKLWLVQEIEDFLDAA